MTPGTGVHLKVDRNGELRDVTLTLGEAPSGKGAGTAAAGPAQNSPMRGVQVSELTADIRQQLGLSSSVKGVVVTAVADVSPAADAGLQRGDVIEQVNRQGVNSVSDYQRLIRQAGNQAVLLLVNRGGNSIFVVVESRSNKLL
jgi:serine protease Do